MKKMRRACAIFLAVLMLMGLVMPTAAANTNHPFTDLPATAWINNAVQFVWENNIMAGVGGNHFDPGGYFTRAQTAAAIFRIEHGRLANASDGRTNHFVDVPNNEWFAPYVTWAANNGVVNGTSATTFDPNGFITRQELVTMLFRYATSSGDNVQITPGFNLNSFTDSNQIETWANNAMRWAVEQGVMGGRGGGILAPIDRVLRSEAAQFMMNFVNWRDDDTVYHTVTFDLAGGTGTFPVQQVATGETLTRPTVNPTREEHEFTGWSWDFTEEVTSNITVTARWRAVTTARFDLRDMIGMTYRSFVADYEILLGNFDHSDQIHWTQQHFPDPDLTIASSRPHPQPSGLDDIIFRAFVDFHEVQNNVFHIGGIDHRSTRENVLAVFGEPDQTSTVGRLVHYRYNISAQGFIRFDIDTVAGYVMQVFVEDVRVIDEPRHVYHTVSFNLAGGQGNFPSQQVRSSERATLPEGQPTRQGFEFIGWSWNFDNPVTGNITVTAQWRALPGQPPAGLPQSAIDLPNRRLQAPERNNWIAEYGTMGGAFAMEREVIARVNAIREAEGLTPLEQHNTLMLAARFYAQTMARFNTALSHSVGPYGGSRQTADAFRVHLECTVRAIRFNASAGIGTYATPESIVNRWMESPGHRDNILATDVTHIGFGSHLGGEWGAFHYMMLG